VSVSRGEVGSRVSRGNTTEIWISLPRAFGSRKEYVSIPGSLSIDELVEFAVGRLEEALYEVCRDGYEIVDAEPRETARGWSIEVEFYCGDLPMATVIDIEGEGENRYAVAIREPRRLGG
jgi:hypothetical protein